MRQKVPYMCVTGFNQELSSARARKWYPGEHAWNNFIWIIIIITGSRHGIASRQMFNIIKVSTANDIMSGQHAIIITVIRFFNYDYFCSKRDINTLIFVTLFQCFINTVISEHKLSITFLFHLHYNFDDTNII